MKTKKQSFLVELSLALASLVFFLLVSWLGLEQSLKASLEKTSQPVLKVTHQGVWHLRQGWRSFAGRAAAVRRVSQLEQDYSQALAEIAELQTLQAENQELRKLLAFKPKTQERAIASTILAYGQPSLNLGTEAGLKTGQPVLAAQTLVGFVDQVSSHQAQVRLLVQQQSQSVLAKTESGVEGLVRGDGQKIILTEVAKDEELQKGQLVVTNGQEGLSSDLVIGRILQVRTEPNAPIQEAILEQTVSFYEVSVVEVLL